MAEPLFIAQAKLESWIEQGEVTFQDNVLTLLAEKKSYTLAPAVRVLTLIDGKDTQGLLGRVVTVAELEGLAAEHFPKTVLLGDTGYECEDGFVGTEQGGAAEAPATVTPDNKAPGDAPKEMTSTDESMLVDFLLKHL